MTSISNLLGAGGAGSAGGVDGVDLRPLTSASARDQTSATTSRITAGTETAATAGHDQAAVAGSASAGLPAARLRSFSARMSSLAASAAPPRNAHAASMIGIITSRFVFRCQDPHQTINTMIVMRRCPR